MIYLLKQFFCLLIFIFLVIILLPFAFSIPLIRIGKLKKSKGKNIYIIKDSIHADFIIESDYLNLDYKEKYLQIGWGDRKIFLETQKWKDLEPSNALKAFLGMNTSVLRMVPLNDLPLNARSVELDESQIISLVNYIKKSNNGKIIKKEKTYYQTGDYYESDLNYNCITNCNNWINNGLRVAGINNRIWCPISFYI